MDTEDKGRFFHFFNNFPEHKAKIKKIITLHFSSKFVFLFNFLVNISVLSFNT